MTLPKCSSIFFRVGAISAVLSFALASSLLFVRTLSQHGLRISPQMRSGRSRKGLQSLVGEVYSVLHNKGCLAHNNSVHKNSVHKNSVHNNTKLIATKLFFTTNTKLITNNSKLITKNTKLGGAEPRQPSAIYYLCHVRSLGCSWAAQVCSGPPLSGSRSTLEAASELSWVLLGRPGVLRSSAFRGVPCILLVCVASVACVSARQAPNSHVVCCIEKIYVLPV